MCESLDCLIIWQICGYDSTAGQGVSSTPPDTVDCVQIILALLDVIEASGAALAIPVTLMALTALVAGRMNGASVARNFAMFGYAIIPLDVAGHVAHNLFHLFAEGKAVWFTALMLVGQQVGEESRLSPSSRTLP